MTENILPTDLSGAPKPRSHLSASQAIFGAGVVVILAGLFAALLPLVDGYSGAVLIGAMLMLAGAFEAIGGTYRPIDKAATVLPGLMTLVAGVAFLFDPFGSFIPQVRLIIAWLMARAILLAAGGLLAEGRVRGWTYVAALTDFTLAATLLIGLSTSTFIFALFGATPAIVASFAWVLGASFLASGLLLLETARWTSASLGD